MPDDHEYTSVPVPLSLLRRVLQFVCRILLILVAAYAGFVLIGLVPVNNDYVPAANGVEIYVTSNPVHADLILPIRNSTIDWRKDFPDSRFSGDTSEATHVAIGWGDRNFFLNTPTWEDLKFGTAAYALLCPSETCCHVSLKNQIRAAPNVRRVRISHAQYARLVKFIRDTFKTTNDHVQQIKGAHYSSNDAFFEARGSYHCGNTCNSWVGHALATSGVRVGWMTPLPKSVFLYLPD